VYPSLLRVSRYDHCQKRKQSERDR
jgi:hypothetical protein